MVFLIYNYFNWSRKLQYLSIIIWHFLKVSQLKCCYGSIFVVIWSWLLLKTFQVDVLSLKNMSFLVEIHMFIFILLSFKFLHSLLLWLRRCMHPLSWERCCLLTNAHRIWCNMMTHKFWLLWWSQDGRSCGERLY